LKGNTGRIYKVVGTSPEPNTYALKASGVDVISNNIPESKIMKAKQDAKWVDYWDAVSDPYRDWCRKEEMRKKKEAKSKKSSKK
jgi:hypothetical protein